MDAHRYDLSLPKKPTGQNQAEEDRLSSRFARDPSCQDQLLTEPSIIVDCYGKILAWYLPGALSQARQVWIPYYLSTHCH